MLCVFIKELRQFRRSQTLVVMCFLVVLLSAASFAVSKSPKHQDFIPPLLSAIAHLFSGIFQLSVIAIAGSRWKNENGDGSIDIVRTTPVSPIKVACAKIAAAAACAYPAYAISAIATYLAFPQNIPLLHLLISGLLQITALCSLALGCATFQSKKRGSVDWTMLAVIFALFPAFAAIFRGFSQGVSTSDFILIDSILAAISAFGISLCICGASPKSSDRAMVLKLTVAAAALVMPVILKYTHEQQTPLSTLYGNSLFFAAMFIIVGALFERMKQTRRVLASPSSKYLFIFGTGTANSLVLFVILGSISLLLSGCRFLTLWSILAKVLFFTGICQLTRDKKLGNFPSAACIVIAVLIPAAAICKIYLPAEQQWICDLFMFHKKCSVTAAAIFTAAGAFLYVPVCVTFYKQYFRKVKHND